MFQMSQNVEGEYQISERKERMHPTECSRCHGARKVFICARWVESKGHCCPGGTHRLSCPGRTVACRECAGRRCWADNPKGAFNSRLRSGNGV